MAWMQDYCMCTEGNICYLTNVGSIHNKLFMHFCKARSQYCLLSIKLKHVYILEIIPHSLYH